MQLAPKARPPASTDLPDLPAAKPIKDAIAAHEAAVAREKELRTASLKAEHAVEQAQKADVQALADQYEKGGKKATWESARALVSAQRRRVHGQRGGPSWSESRTAWVRLCTDPC
jgi:hypothetical protein